MFGEFCAYITLLLLLKFHFLKLKVILIMSYKPSFRIEIIILFRILTMWKTWPCGKLSWHIETLVSTKFPLLKIKMNLKSLICDINLGRAAAAAAKSLQSCPTLWPHRRQPTRLPRPWNSPGKNTGVGCHCLLHVACYSVANMTTAFLSCVF